MNSIRPIANDFVKVTTSPDPQNIYCYSPGICVLQNGRIIATMDHGGVGVVNLKGSVADNWGSGKHILGRAFASDDGGKTWQHLIDFPFYHARPFVAGNALYILGHNADLHIIRSDDDGASWTSPAKLSHGEVWHQAPCNVHYAKGNVYLVMERKAREDIEGWTVSVHAPVLMRAKVDADLEKREAWTFASELVFRDVVKDEDLDYLGMPFFKTPEKSHGYVAKGKDSAPMGWLETNVVQFTDPNHYWYDEKEATFHLWMRSHTAQTGFACVAKVCEREDGSMETMLERVPSGKKALWVPCPGGQLKFHILYDPKSKLFWLLSNQATDSYTRADKISKERSGLPSTERWRLQLHFSKNCIDWCFAALVAQGDSPKQARNYASMAFCGEDLLVLARSGDRDAASDHDGNFISFHRIASFRELLY